MLVTRWAWSKFKFYRKKMRRIFEEPSKMLRERHKKVFLFFVFVFVLFLFCFCFVFVFAFRLFCVFWGLGGPFSGRD